MKWFPIRIELPKIIPLMKDLLHKDRALREDRVRVTPYSDVKSRSVDRRIRRPWKTIPNICDFTITLSTFDWIPLLFGFRVRNDPKLELHQWQNERANLYIDYMFKRLRKEVEMKLFDKAARTVWILMNSTAYQVACINYVFKNWHRKLTLTEVKAIAKGVSKLAKRRDNNLRFKRKYIPKDEHSNKMRPLGVPAPIWRVYLHMYNNCLVEWRLVTERNAQHGYLPGRGIITAWIQLTKLLKSRNIFEADFQGFFDGVTATALDQELTNIGLPEKERTFLEGINKRHPKVGEEDWSQEFRFRGILHLAGLPNFVKWDQERAQLINIGYAITKGVPQGAPTSCSLATMALRYLERQFKILFYADDVIYFPESSQRDPYADLTVPEYGLKVNRSKSRWLKKDGIWLVDSFKFLGVRYYPPKGAVNATEEFQMVLFAFLLDMLISMPICTLIVLTYIYLQRTREREKFEADTRKGAKLSFTDSISFLSYLGIARELLLKSPYESQKWSNTNLRDWLLLKVNKWSMLKSKMKLLFYEGEHRIDGRTAIIRNPYTGLILSRMHLDSWDVAVLQNFKMKAIQGSWVDLEWGRYSLDWLIPRDKLTVFTASSFACHDLLHYLTGWKNRRRKATIRKIST